MMSFFEYLEWHRGRGLPDTRTMMKLAGVSLHTPNKNQMQRAVDRAKGRLVVPMPVVPGGHHHCHQASGKQNNNLGA